MGNPPKRRKYDVNKPVTSDVIGYIWEIHAIRTNIFILAQTVHYQNKPIKTAFIQAPNYNVMI